MRYFSDFEISNYLRGKIIYPSFFGTNPRAPVKIAPPTDEKKRSSVYQSLLTDISPAPTDEKKSGLGYKRISADRALALTDWHFKACGMTFNLI